MEKQENVFVTERLDAPTKAAVAAAPPRRTAAAVLSWNWAALCVADADESEAEYAALVALLGAVSAEFRTVPAGRERVLARRVECALRLEGAALYDGARRLVSAARLAPATRRRVAALVRQYLDAEDDDDDDEPAAAATAVAVAVHLRRCRHKPSVARLVDVGSPSPERSGNFF